MRKQFVAWMLLAAAAAALPLAAGVLPEQYRLEPFATSLDRAEAAALAPAGRIFVLERVTGNVRVVRDGMLSAAPFVTVPVATNASTSEAGLLGIAVHPDFLANGWVYLYYTHDLGGGNSTNRIVRYTAAGDVGIDPAVLLDNIGAGPSGNDNGGALAFGPDGMLYAAVGVMEDDSSAVLCVFRPYGKRTWLVISVGVEKGRAAEFEEREITAAGDLLAVLQKHDVGQEGIVGDAPAVYKAWLTRLGGKRFMTWEPVGDVEHTKYFLPDAWFVFGVMGQSEGGISLAMLDPEYEEFEGLVEEVRGEADGGEVDVWKARKRWERVIRKHADDPALYSNDVFRFGRLPDELESKAARLVAWPFDY